MPTPESAQYKRATLQALREKIGQIRPFKTPRKGFTEAQRRGVFAAYDGCCAGCDEALQPGWHIDHIKPLRAGGEHAPRNWMALCPDCHRDKSAAESTGYARADRLHDREVNGRKPSKHPLRGRPFDKSMSRKFDGTVVRRGA
jgi:5-methylcytosine-specific restriction protein A